MCSVRYLILDIRHSVFPGCLLGIYAPAKENSSSDQTVGAFDEESDSFASAAWMSYSNLQPDLMGWTDLASGAEVNAFGRWSRGIVVGEIAGNVDLVE